MKKNVLVAVIALLLSFNFIAAQQIENPAKSNVIPPSPTAASLGRYGDTPVSLYTGVPQIGIPLFEIKERGVAVSISLNYQASGVRVEELPSWVGQSWSLSAGGVITRTVRGLPDEQDNGYSGFAKMGEKVERYLANQMTTDEAQAFQKNVSDGIWDAEPDMYFFNFQGKSGKIIFDKNAVPTIIPAQNLVVEGNILEGFSITTEDGTKYSFGEAETTERLDACDIQLTLPFNSSWYLTTIEKDGFMVNFSYTNGVTYQNVLPTETGYTLLYAGDITCGGMGTQLGCAMVLKMNTKRLSSIITSGLSQVIFKSITPRTDLQSPSVDYRLDSVIVLQGGNVTKKFHLDYEAGGCNRLMLKTVREISAKNELLPPHRFEYYNSNLLPCTTSKSQDHWGFYNGTISSTLLPQQFYLTQGNSLVNLIGSDRSSSFENAKIGTMNRIIYPTGGWTDLIFESNEYGYRMGSGEVNEPNLVPATLSKAVLSPNTSVSGTFTIGTRQFVQVDYSVNYSGTSTYPDNGEYVRIKDATNNYVMTRSFGTGTAYLDLYPGVYTAEAFSANAATTTQFLVKYKTTEPGILKRKICGGLRIKKVIVNDGQGGNPKVTNYKYVMESDSTRSSGVIMGEPKYDYMFRKHVLMLHKGDGEPDEAPCDYIVRTANSNVLGATQGSHVGYKEVRVEELNNGYSISRFSSPMEYPDLITFGYPFAIGTSFDYQRGNLLQKVDYSQLSPATFSPVQKSSSTYAISIFNRKVIKAVKIGYRQTYPKSTYLNTFASVPYDYVSEWQYMVNTTNETYSTNSAQTAPLVSSKTFSYDNPNHMQVTSVLTTNSKTEDVLTKFIYPMDYASTTDPVINKMKGVKHMHNDVIETVTKTKRNNTWYVDAASFAKYGEMINSQGVSAILPVQVYQLELKTPIAESTFLESVANNAQPNNLYSLVNTITYNPQTFNLAEIQSRNDNPVSYLWSYKSTLPIAEFKNTSYLQLKNAIAAASLQEDVISNGVFSDAQIQQFLTSIKAQLPSGRVMSYTHLPLVGPTSVIDVNGKGTFYKYDNFGRLLLVKDNEGNILNKYEYKYKSQ